MIDTLGTWVAAIATLSMMSFAWRENRFYRAFEHIFIGIGAGHATVMGIQNLKSNLIRPIQVDQHYVALIPMLLGLLLYTRFFKGYSRFSRLPMAVLVGIGTGLTLRGTIGSQLVAQLQATMLPINNLDNIIMVFGTTTVIIFFYFTAGKHKNNPVLKISSKVGRYVMMVAFGATFGNTVMGRMSMMIGRIQFLIGDWLHLI